MTTFSRAKVSMATEESHRDFNVTILEKQTEKWKVRRGIDLWRLTNLQIVARQLT